MSDRVAQSSTSEWVLAYVALGCNLGDRKANLNSAVQALYAHSECQQIRVSSFYETEPMGPADQPDYMNGVLGMQTRLAPLALLDTLQAIEQDHGRVRDGRRWGPRTLDLDLLLYGESIINTPRLTVPHPGIAERSFVLIPLLEIAPELVIPELGRVEELATQCQQFGIRRLNFTV